MPDGSSETRSTLNAYTMASKTLPSPFQSSRQILNHTNNLANPSNLNNPPKPKPLLGAE